MTTPSFCIFSRSAGSGEAGASLEEWGSDARRRFRTGPLLDACSEIGRFVYNQPFVYGVDATVVFFVFRSLAMWNGE